eukprot:TRINITY_DN111533_c0_g1_i1.p1 TRINITY_DN111533_c0_g1~~TRINITY_DN111533_c0_g1_i1.p1  ORF type:complete len:785 (+),score=102.48 TRINITY_DN111533_c0_g1_i1:63-2357(+)
MYGQQMCGLLPVIISQMLAGAFGRNPADHMLLQVTARHRFNFAAASVQLQRSGVCEILRDLVKAQTHAELKPSAALIALKSISSEVQRQGTCAFPQSGSFGADDFGGANDRVALLATIEPQGTFVQEFWNHTVEQKMHSERRVQAARDLLAASLDNISSCADGGDATETLHTPHTDCRIAEGLLKESLQNLQADFHDYWKNLTLPEGYGEFPFDAASKALDYVQALKNMSTDAAHQLEAKQAAVLSATHSHGNQTQQCAALQASFESAVCQEHANRTQSCGKYGECYAERVRAHVHLVAEVQEIEMKSKGEYTSAHMIQCHLWVLNETNITQQSEMLQGCMSMQTVNTSLLDITYPNVSGQTECPENPVVCGDAWLQEKYFDKSWYANAPAANCTPCGLDLEPNNSDSQPIVSTTTTTTRLDVSFANSPIESLDLEAATGLTSFQGGFHDGTYGYVAGGTFVVRFELASFSNVQTLDIRIRAASHHDSIFHDGTYGYAIQNNPFKIARFGLADFAEVTELDLSSSTDKTNCKNGFVYGEYIYVQCHSLNMRFPTQLFNGTETPSPEILTWPSDFSDGGHMANSFHMIRCGSQVYVPGGHYIRKLMRFDLEEYASTDVVDIYPSETQAGFCDGAHGYIVPHNDAWASWGTFTRWSLSNMEEKQSFNLNGNQVPSMAAFPAAFSDGTYGYALPGARYNGNYWVANGPHYHLVRFELASFSADTVQVLDLSQRNSDWTYFSGGFQAGSYGYMVPRAHGNLLRFALTS